MTAQRRIRSTTGPKSRRAGKPTLDKLGRDARTVVIAVIAASVVAGPSAAAAAYVANADKVDNKHAVGAGATTTARKGKLVATKSTTGLLPNDIIAKAPDAGMLDGRSLDQVRAHRVTEFDGQAQDLTGTPASKTSITITVPGPGSVEVSGFAAMIANKPSTSSQAYGQFILTSNPTPPYNWDSLAMWGVAYGAAAGDYYNTLPVTDTFQVTAGTHTFHLIGTGKNTKYGWSQLNAQFLPE